MPEPVFGMLVTRGSDPLCSSTANVFFRGEHADQAVVLIATLVSASLQLSRATVRGQRVVHPWRRWTGFALILLSLTGPAAWFWYGATAWYPWLPSMTLRYLVENSNLTDAVAAYKELDRRHTLGQLSDSELIDIALTMHGRPLADPNRPTVYGPFLGREISAGNATDSQRQQFIDQFAAALTLRVRRNLQPGGPTPVRFRMGRGVPRPLVARVTIRSIGEVEDGRTTELNQVAAFSMGIAASGMTDMPLPFPPASTGPQTLSFVLDSELVLNRRTFSRPDAPVAASCTTETRCKVTVVEVDRIDPLSDATDSVAGVVEVVGLMAAYHRRGEWISFEQAFESSAIPQAFELHVNAGDGFRKTDVVLARAAGDMSVVPLHFKATPAELAAIQARRSIEVLFVPSVEQARRTVDLDSIWPTALL